MSKRATTTLQSPLALCAALLFAAAPLSAAEPVSLTVDRIAAVVGSEIILQSDVQAEARPALLELIRSASQGGGGAIPKERKLQVVKDTLNRMVDEQLVAQQAGEMQITVTTEDVDRLLTEEARGQGVELDVYRKAVEAQGIDWLTFRNMKRNQLLAYKVLSLKVRGRVKISETEARQFYNDQVRDVRKTGSFVGAHILIRIPANAGAAELAKSRDRATNALQRVKGGEDFVVVAQEVSEDPATAKAGGVLGRLETGKLPAILDRAFLDLETGEVAGPIRTAAGFHIIKLVERQALGVQPFAEVKDRIMNQLMQQEMMRQQEIWLKDLRRRAFIDIRLFKDDAPRDDAAKGED